ncbi:hypothetical protein JIG36_39445 [Actinoplanes sp. LDG1-06]|uniref:Uncharacterized protein n=1 Tax=Paractinoplanes ovalisporus TaxID=2810368 RepID=A0ABS2AP38_9ACTN|nr:hypothetical protein [Actinoplanes ovalisporus]MBM2621596.1 hypothetical protein [Actinoplanes ovalisporus]
MDTEDDAQRTPPQGTRPQGASPFRRRMVIGGIGLAAVLGGGAYLMTAQVSDRQATTSAPDVAPVQPAPTTSAAPATSDVAPPPSVSATGMTSAGTARPPAEPSPSRSPSPARSEDSAAVRREIDRARAQAAKDGHPLQRPLQQKAQAVPGSQVSTRTEPTSEGTIRISTARADLTGQQDQLIAGDGGKPVGSARCTQKVRFSEGAPAREVANLLLCWRMSADRSVVTLAVAKEGTPSSSISTATIDREWARLD